MSESSKPARFVNPYTFVPFPESPPHRTPPNGQAGGLDPDLLSGELTVNVQAQTPLLLRNITREEDGIARLPRRPDGRVFIPGSSLKGAIRSLHETLTGSCLRVFDSDYVPGYRDTANAKTSTDIKLAVVETHSSPEDPPVLKLCDERDKDPRSLRIHQDDLERMHADGPLTSGDAIAVSFNPKTGKPENPQRLTPDDTTAENGTWIVFLSDGKAPRMTSTKPKKHLPYKAPIRWLSNSAQRVHVPPEAWANYRHSLNGSDDQRTANVSARDKGDFFAEVTYEFRSKQHRLGRRWLANEKLAPGQPVWVKLDGDKVTAIRHAMIWRHQGEFSAGDRAKSFGPCTDDQDLCPSCRVFGSAETRPDANPAAEQKSYRGHVRFGDAVADFEVTEPAEPVALAPLSMPRPGSGQFYLVNDQNTEGNADQHALREWGSPADGSSAEQARGLRGRKYYWHTPLDGQDPPARARARAHQRQGKMSDQVKLIPKGVAFTAKLTFTDLTPVQLGGLLSSLDPAKYLNAEVWQHIGGGRPLGLGSCTVEVNPNSRVWRSADRYRARDGIQDIDAQHYVEVFSEWVAEQLPAVHKHRSAITKALSPATIPNPGIVWYPPGGNWGELGGEEFDRGYAFWRQTQGLAHSSDGVRKGYPLQSLPHISEPDQSMEIVTSAKSKPLPQQNPHPMSRKGNRK